MWADQVDMLQESMLDTSNSHPIDLHLMHLTLTSSVEKLVHTFTATCEILVDRSFDMTRLGHILPGIGYHSFGSTNFYFLRRFPQPKWEAIFTEGCCHSTLHNRQPDQNGTAPWWATHLSTGPFSFAKNRNSRWLDVLCFQATVCFTFTLDSYTYFLSIPTRLDLTDKGPKLRVDVGRAISSARVTSSLKFELSALIKYKVYKCKFSSSYVCLLLNFY